MTDQTKFTESIQSDVMPLREATDNVTALESRGDFKYKGIFGLYNYVLETTNRFSSNRILPEISQVKREVPLPENKFEEYMLELTGRGNMKSPMLLMFPSIDFIASSGKLTELSILCRPTQSEGSSAKRYVDFYRQKSVEALSSWLKFNESHWHDMNVDTLYRFASQSGLHNTHAGAIIAKYFVMTYDRTADQRADTYKNYVRPIIQQLIDEKKILYLKDAALNFHTIQFGDQLSLKHRLEMLASCCVTAIPGFQSPAELNADLLSEQAERLYKESLSVAQKQLIAELRLVLTEFRRIQRVQKEKEQKDQVGNALTDLTKLDRVISTNHFRNWDEDFVRKVIGLPDVLNAEFPQNGKVLTYVLVKSKIYPAVLNARKQLDERDDETEIRILSSMGISRFLEGEQLKVFEGLEERIYFNRLPWYKRLWRAFFGRSRLSQEESNSIREKLRKEELDEQIFIKKRQAERATRRIAEEQIETKKKGNSLDDVIPANSFEEQTAKTKEAMQVDERADEVLRKVIDLLDSFWDKKELPNRTQVLEGVADFDNNEDTMIVFLKKYGRKQIYSFRVMRDDPKFVWPILVSRRYLQRHGKRLLREAVEESDRQRQAMMPDQEKFDVAIAIEDFLNKLMNKR